MEKKEKEEGRAQGREKGEDTHTSGAGALQGKKKERKGKEGRACVCVWEIRGGITNMHTYIILRRNNKTTKRRREGERMGDLPTRAFLHA